LAKLGSNVDAPRVSSCIGTIGGLLRSFFSVDVDAATFLGGAIVLYKSLLHLTYSSLLFFHLDLCSLVFAALYGNKNNNNFTHSTLQLLLSHVFQLFLISFALELTI
jgi:hypothetical protein